MKKERILEMMLSLLELPDSAYEKAEERYNDLGQWLARKESACAANDPHIFPQGSFRLGTAIKPLDDKESYDLDLGCRLVKGISRQTHSQFSLKNLVGGEVEAFRLARGIKALKEEKHRCWRLEYADKLSFHMDIVPSIPADELKKRAVFESMKSFGERDATSASVSQDAIFITDNRSSDYKQISDKWLPNNTEGYAKWFVERMQHGVITHIEKAKVDELPVYKRKTVLQRVVQILKRHRDQMFKDDPSVKPISAIITTLAARAYQGESNLETALKNVLTNMHRFVSSSSPRVANPANPGEDFADKWSMSEYKELKLEDNFWLWLDQAKSDFELIGSLDVRRTFEQGVRKFAVNLNENDLGKLGLQVETTIPKVHVITKSEANRPWLP